MERATPCSAPAGVWGSLAAYTVRGAGVSISVSSPVGVGNKMTSVHLRSSAQARRVGIIQPCPLQGLGPSPEVAGPGLAFPAQTRSLLLQLSHFPSGSERPPHRRQEPSPALPQERKFIFLIVLCHWLRRWTLCSHTPPQKPSGQDPPLLGVPGGRRLVLGGAVSCGDPSGVPSCSLDAGRPL